MPAFLTNGDGQLPDPPYKPNIRIGEYSPIYHLHRVHASKTYRMADPWLRAYTTMMWLEAWGQYPVGSYENDDEEIALVIGLPIDRLRDPAVRAVLARGWYLCSDGRIYHQFISTMVLEMLTSRVASRDRQRKFRASRATGPESHDVTRDMADVTGGNAAKVKVKVKGKIKEKEENQRQAGANGHDVASPVVASARGTRFGLPALPEDWRSYCKDKHPDIDPDAMFEAFSDYWRAKASNGTKLDWFLTWKTWLRRDQLEVRRRSPPRSRHATPEQVRRLAAQYDDEEPEKGSGNAT